MEGHLVNIVIPGKDEYLTLCEVEVFGAETEGGYSQAMTYYGFITVKCIYINNFCKLL